MPTRFESYRMRDGVTPLSEDFFNPVLADIDARIARMEEQRTDLQGVIDELSRFGLARIDTLVGPSMAAVSNMLAELTQLRDELVAAVGDVGNLITQAQLDAAITAEQAARQEAIELATARPTAATYTYEAGRVVSMSETLPTGDRTTTYTYDGAGRLTQAVQTHAGTTRTTTYTYGSDGALISITVTET